MARALSAVYLLSAESGHAASIAIHVTADGHPLPNAVVTAVPHAPAPITSANRAHPKATMVQQSQQFAPFVLPVQVGTVVDFPNRDPFRHHVYSFSPAKPFELKLYGGNQAETVTFDKPGIVALGCNIHDNMLAYIDVVPTPYFVKTGPDGDGEIKDIPPGAYTVALWHPDQGKAPAEQTVSLTAAKTDINFTTEILRQHSQRRSGAVDENPY